MSGYYSTTYNRENKRAKETTAIKIVWKAIEERVLVESPVAKLASSEVPPSDSEPVPDTSGTCGEAFVADFTLHMPTHKINMSIVNMYNIKSLTI